MGRTKRQRSKKKTSLDLENIIELRKWLKIKTKLKIGFFERTGRGVLSTCNIDKNDILVSLPIKNMITLDVIKNSDLYKILQNVISDTQTLLALFLIYEAHKGDLSYYQTYIKVLPQNYTSFISSNKNDIECLPLWMKALVIQQKTDVDVNFERIAKLNSIMCGHCHSTFGQIFTYDQFIWGWLTVNTRGVYFNESSRIALAPFLDFFNYSNEASVEVVINNNHYMLKTHKACKKYQEVFIKYGGLSNLKLLVEYGFISDNLNQDVVYFDFQEIITNFESITYEKIKYLSRNPQLKENLYKSFDGFSWNFNSLLYVLYTTKKNFSNNILYSMSLSKEEEISINNFKHRIITLKNQQLQTDLKNVLHLTSDPFKMAKQLIEQYITILNH